MPAGRNDACPCGSGKKYKNCCVNKRSSLPRGLLLLLAAIALIAAAGLLPTLFADKEKKEAAFASPLPARRGPVTQPGVAPPGKVWSAEHGHWHDAAPPPSAMPMPLVPAGSAPPSPVQVQSAPAFTPGPQPAGPVPAGKVWSAEHGHWHDLPK